MSEATPRQVRFGTIRQSCVGVLLALVAGITPAHAQSRPIVTGDPVTVAPGHVRIEAGFDFLRDATLPASGLTGDLSRLGTFSVSFAAGPRTEIQIAGGVRNRLRIHHIDPAAPGADALRLMAATTSDVEDPAIGAKVRVLTESAARPAIAIRFVTRLPTAGNESGLGLDTMDFHFLVLLAKTVPGVRVGGALGVGILGDPVRAGQQNDVLDYGVWVARSVTPRVEILAELAGRRNTRSGIPPVATGTRAVGRVGARVKMGDIRIDGALLVGATERDPAWGVTAGLTWVFRAFPVRQP